MAGGANIGEQPGYGPFVGRVAELSTVQQRIQSGAQTMVVGAGGCGKTRLVGESLRRVGGRRIAMLRGTNTGRSITLGAFERLLPPSVDDARSAAAHLRAAWASGPTPVVVVDDAHLLDDLSAFVLRALAEDGSCLVLATATEQLPWPEHMVLLQQIIGEEGTVRLGALSPLHVRALAEQQLGGRISEHFLRRLVRLTSGNVLELKELLAAAQSSDAIAMLGGMWDWPGPPLVPARLAAHVRSRLDALGEPAVTLFETVALARSIPVAALPELLATDLHAVLAAADALERERFVRSTVSPAALAVGHPLYAEVVVASLTPARRRAHAARLGRMPSGAESLDVYHRSVFLLEAGEPVGKQQLVDAASLAHARGNHAGAAALSEVLVADGGDYVAHRLLAANRRPLGDIDGARASFRACVDLAENEWEVVNALGSLAELEFDCGETPDAATAVLDEFGPHPLLDIRRALHAVLSGDHLSAVAMLDGITIDVRELMIGASIPYSLSATLAGDGERGVRIAADALAERVRLGIDLYRPTIAILGVAVVFAELQRAELMAAERLATEGFEHSSTIDDHIGQGWFALMRGDVGLVAGRYVDAEAWFREALVQFTTSRFPSARWACAGVALAAGQQGDHEGAARALTLLDALGPTCWRILDYELCRAQAWVLAAKGERAAAAEHLRSWLVAQPFPSVPSRLAFALDLARLGASDVDARCTVTADDGPLAAVVADHLEALRSRRAEALAEVSARYSELGFDGAGVDSLVQAALCAREAGDAAANGYALEARTAADRCGSAMWSLELLTEAVPVRGRPAEIGALAAAGATNAAIAESLVLSVRTVDNHLATLFRLLRISRRDEIGAAMFAWTGERPASHG